MELLKGDDFHQHPTITARQRLSYWSGFFYYFSTAVNVFFAPIPALVMVWLYPERVRPENLLPLAGVVLLWLVVYPLVMRSRWRLEVIRVQTIYGFTHAVAIFDVFFGKPAAWVPSHGTNKATPLAVKVKRTMAGYLGVTLGLTLAGIGLRLAQPEYSLSAWWALLAFVAINLYVFVPVLARSVSTLVRDARAAEPAAAPAPNVVAPLPADDVVPLATRPAVVPTLAGGDR